MSENISTLQRVTRLNGTVTALLSRQDLDGLSSDERKLVLSIKRQLADARLDVRDYEMADTRAEMLQNAKEAVGRLETVRADILKASESDIFNPIEVTEITTDIEQIIEEVNAT